MTDLILKTRAFHLFLIFIIIFPKIVIFPVLVRRCGMKNEKFNKHKTVEIHSIFQMLYKNSNGFVKIMSQGNRKGYFYNTEVLCNAEKLYAVLNSHRFRKNNLYISLGTFKTMENARQDNLLTVNALALDVDYTLYSNQENITYEEASKALELAILDGFPAPTYIEHSRNMRLIYILQHPYILKKGKSKPCRDFLNRVVLMLCESLNKHMEIIHFNATPHKLTSFLRIPYSTNLRYLDPYDPHDPFSKKPCVKRYLVEFTLIGSTWDIDKLAEYVLPEKFPGYDEWKKHQHQLPSHTYITGPSSVCEKRLKELQSLQFRGYGIGYRERLCYLYWITARQNGMDAREAIDSIKEYNEHFYLPLSEHQLLTDCKPSPYIDGRTGLHCEGWERHFTDKSIREFLGIGSDEPDLFQGEGMTTKERSKKYRKKQRIKKELAGNTKKQQIEQQLPLISTLRTNGYTWKEIAEQLHVSICTAKRYGARLKELEKGA